jgi:hypothetical protein
MADLPDIDTSTVSFLSYWNAIEHGGADSTNWDPSEVASYGGVQTTTGYDNGIEGDVSLAGNNRVSRFRAKEDGWLVVWLDTTAEVGNNLGSRPSGPWDITSDWDQAVGYNVDANPATINNDALSKTLYGLFGATDVSGNVNVSFSYGDVGYYDYSHPGATNISLLSHGGNWSGATHDASYTDPETVSFSYTGSTTLQILYCWGVANEAFYNRNNTSDNENEWTSTTLGGTNAPTTVLCDSVNTPNREEAYGARIGENIDFGQASSTPFDTEVNAAEYFHDEPSGGSASSAGHHLLLWS